MALDPRFICTSDLDSYFVDKITGEPLAAGVLKFYSDLNRTQPKDVYQLTGSPPNYSFSSIGSEVTLNGTGNPQYMGNKILIYYFPFEGTPDDTTGAQELYYVTVESSGAVPQFTRQAWPPQSESGNVVAADTKNYIPNGQFLAHNDFPPVTVIDGNDVYPYAQGGWFFKKSTGTSGIYAISFTRITTTIAGIEDFPRYAVNFACSFYNSENIRDFEIQWPDVNVFSAGDPPGSQQYTFFFAGQSNDSNSYTFDVRLIRNYGTGGTPSPQDDDSIGSVTFDPGYDYHQLSFDFPDNTGKVLGTNNDDYIGIALRGPTGTFDVQFTDFALIAGGVAPQFFPVEINAAVLGLSISGTVPTPNPDGSDLYLPLILTPEGATWDHADVGKIFSAGYTIDNLAPNELVCHGQGYQSNTYSSVGIPYSRLLNKYWDSTFNVPIWGTGYNFATCYISATNTSNLRISTNVGGSQTASNAGTSGFTISSITNGGSNSTDAFAFNTGTNTILVQSAINSTGTAADGGVSTGFTIAVTRNTASTFFYFTISIPAVPPAGSYFTYTVGANSYYVWFRVNGAGANPMPGGTEIRVDLLSTYTAAEVAQCVSAAISGYQLTKVVIGAAPAAGTYFYFYASGTQYVVWYTVDGSGSQPSVVGATYIPVAILSSDTTAQVATKTQIAINRFYVGVPDLRGVILRGIDSGNPVNWDLNTSTRFNQTIATYFGAKIGTIELDQIYSHTHSTVSSTTLTNLPTGGGQTLIGITGVGTTNPNLSLTGGSESRPVNAYVEYVVKY
jgi:hypothetical protein